SKRFEEQEKAVAKATPQSLHDPYFNIVEVTVYGQARFYNPPPEEPPAEASAADSALATGAPAAATPAEDQPQAKSPAEPTKAEGSATPTKSEPGKAAAPGQSASPDGEEDARPSKSGPDAPAEVDP